MEEKKTWAPEGSTAPLSLKVPPGLKKSIESMARAERRTPGNLSALLLEWAFAQLQAAGDTVTLMRSPGVPDTRRISFEMQEQLFTALKMIIERGHPEIVKKVAEKLTRYAAQYGEEK